VETVEYRAGRRVPKLTADDVRDIRYCLANTRISQRALAAEYGVAVSTINNVFQGKTYRSVV